ncbi:unnamed protein product [Cuscuta europaea]|uniref:Zinc finger GRF-type domain-containing protein n=1 Tax=Cuscuta europaea TaxID=41803 RepID=A0A9P0ZH71_CUSEU|nr:unnamed protein product [Cuscuta europaea]
MSSSSTSSKRKNSLSTLNYEPAVYCLCGMKAPLCKGRETGPLFYGCQQFKYDHGCGFFMWRDAMDATHGHIAHRIARDEAAHGGGLFELRGQTVQWVKKLMFLEEILFI